MITKLYPTDSGLACHLCGITDAEGLRESSLLGSMFESYVLQNLSAYTELPQVRSEILYWRTVRGHEVDFVIETPTRLLPIEVKTSTTLGKNDLRGVKAFLKEYPEITPFGVVLPRKRVAPPRPRCHRHPVVGANGTLRVDLRYLRFLRAMV
jgi:predicted AAA+ superfamily ATPase